MADEPGRMPYHEDERRFRDALTHTAAESGFNARLIEKDYYCSIVLRDLGDLFEQGMVFKGGTCLSKVHAEFFRLSEDLDFTIPLPGGASRPARRRAAEPVKAYFAELGARLPNFEIDVEFAGHNENRQYAGRLAYRSVVTGERDFIKVEVGLREELLRGSEILPARTLLVDPYDRTPVVDHFDVRVLCLAEAYAEKIRAALTRRDPAIRDFFDIDHAVGRGLFDPCSPELLGLIAAKLAVFGNEPADLAPSKQAVLRGQVETDLRPVLRTADLEAFDLDRVIRILEEVLGGLSTPDADQE